jgi:phosphoglycerol transferase MdoB-like AlkP superfamily enzyme
MLDNFTYTLFKFGIGNTKGIIRGVYTVSFLVMMFTGYRIIIPRIINYGRNLKGNLRKSFGFISICLIILATGYTFFSKPAGQIGQDIFTSEAVTNRPNILIIHSDGVNASHMSVYGYERDTTPRMKQLAETSLVAENAFSNSGNSSGSVTSLLTGKYPATTRVVFPPDILRGRDAYQHLPGILLAQGYDTIQIGLPHFIDAYNFNFQDAFNMVNGRSASAKSISSSIVRYMPYEISYFLSATGYRLLDRLGHISFSRQMENTYEKVTKSRESAHDHDRVQQLLDILNNSKQPLFIHVHLMETHGGKFFPTEQIFSSGKRTDEQENWDTDFYDDSILEFDRHIGTIVDALIENNQFDKTILVIGSDHGQASNHLTQIPLIIHFPGNAYSAMIQSNTQNLDISPTILDFLGLNQPAWMAGKSLLNFEPEQRPIFGVYVDDTIVSENEDNKLAVKTQLSVPPFYQFGKLSIIYCQDVYVLNLVQRNWAKSEIQGNNDPSSESDRLSDHEIFSLMVNHLNSNGFDTSSLDESIIP